MGKLNTEPNLSDADGLYQKLIDLHQGRGDDESMKINAKLILLLANHIGDAAIVGEAIEIAGLNGVDTPEERPKGLEK